MISDGLLQELRRADGAKMLAQRLYEDPAGLAEIASTYGEVGIKTVKTTLRRFMVTGGRKQRIMAWSYFEPLIQVEQDRERADGLRRLEAERAAADLEKKRADLKRLARAVLEQAMSSGVKPCNRCGATKPLDDFPRHGETRDGRRKTCRACVSAERAAKLPDDPAKIIDLEIGRVSAAKWKERNPEKLRAQRILRDAVRKGLFKRPSKCSVRGCRLGGRIEGHHPDYAKPLQVTWLCHRHHRRHHRREHGGSGAMTQARLEAAG